MVKKKKVILPEKKVKELEGFEEVMDLVGQEGNDFASPKERKGALEDYEIFDFLEKESERLSKLDELFNKKMATIKSYPQLEKLVKKQEEEKNLIKDELSGRLMFENSPLHEKLGLWFDKVFTPNKDLS